MTLLTEEMPWNKPNTSEQQLNTIQEYFYIKSKKLNFLMTWFWSNQLRLFCWDFFFAFCYCHQFNNHNDLKEVKFVSEKNNSMLFENNKWKWAM